MTGRIGGLLGAGWIVVGVAGCGGGSREAESTDIGTSTGSAASTSGDIPTTEGEAATSDTDTTTDTTDTSTTTGTLCEPLSVVPCYTGDPLTQGVGPCVGGSQTCNADGSALGPCEGEVTPVSEDCATPQDEDCDGTNLDEDAGCACEPQQVTPCYTGEPGTQDVGLCHGGVATCEATGLGFGPCVDEVVPALEDCMQPDDEDCDGAANLCPGEALWGNGYGNGAGDQSTGAIAVGLDGASYLIGTMTGAVDFGTGPLVSAGSQDVFLIKLDVDGNTLWAKRFGSPVEEIGFSAAVDAAGNVVIAGESAGNLDLGGGVLVGAGGRDVFLAKLDPAGNHLWSKRFGDAGNQFARSLAITSDDDILLTATFAGGLDLGGGPLVSAGGTDVALARFTANGAHVWSKRFGDAAVQESAGAAVDANDNVVVFGGFNGTVDLGGGPLVSAGQTDLFLARFDPGGGHVWSKRFGDAATQQAIRADVSPVSGAVAITGRFDGTVDFGGGPLVAAGGDVYLAVFDSTGAHLWSRRFGDNMAQTGRGITFDPGGNILTTGVFAGSIDLGGGPLVSGGGLDVYVAKFTDAGLHLASQRGGDAATQYGIDIATDAMGHVFVTGNFAGQLDLGGISLLNTGGEDLFLYKLAP